MSPHHYFTPNQKREPLSDHSQTPPKGMSFRRSAGNSIPHHYCTPKQKREPSLATAKLLPKEVHPFVGVEVTQLHTIIVSLTKSENPFTHPTVSHLRTLCPPNIN
ncbi:hypothetical protein AVEN_248847-1 [Araneus ventricosus]|uniref:Uncharacterized protein n=1 Tax=Araneus ventricosus TaxID=182803 RepID=A0A4Y2MK91_ARAVE|nr:hypothetical protein AVEN_248847-1 [Araneus ventricosus]